MNIHVNLYVDEEIYNAWLSYVRSTGKRTQSSAFSVLPELLAYIPEDRHALLRQKYTHERRGRPKYSTPGGRLP